MGGMIGEGGSTIAEILRHSDCHILMSPSTCFFPGTRDRMLLAGGLDKKAIDACLTLVIHRLRDVVQKSSFGAILVKMVVPKSSVSQIMGKHGNRLQKLSQASGCSINVSPRNHEMQERLVLFSGLAENILMAARCVCQQMQQDPNLVEHMHFESDLELPLGIWDYGETGPAEPEHPLVSPKDCDKFTRRELIEYLLKAAPRYLLLKHRLLGSVQKSLKRHSMEAVLAIVNETWRIRSGQTAGDIAVETEVFMAQELEMDQNGNLLSLVLRHSEEVEELQ